MDDNIACQLCGWVYMSAPDRTLHMHRCHQWRKDRMAKANDRQEGGTHYRMMAIQPWDFIAVNGIGYFEGSAIAYLARWKEKGGIQDLRKARHYVDKLIEMEEAKIVGNG